MKIVNVDSLEEVSWASPKGRFEGHGKQVSEALGRVPDSLDLAKRHPFDVEIVRVPPGKINFPYHSHSAQWEYYQVVSGQGTVRDHEDQRHAIGPGDAFLFPTGEAHQIESADDGEDLVFLVVADNPVGECYYYPDSRKWGLRHPERRMFRGDALDYYDGEE